MQVDTLEDLGADAGLESDGHTIEEALLGGMDGGVRGSVRVDDGGEVVDGVVGLDAKAAVS